MTPSRRRTRIWLGLSLPIIGTVVALTMAVSTGATCSSCVHDAGLESGFTTHKGCPRGQPVDPINILWHGNKTVRPKNIAGLLLPIGYNYSDYDYSYLPGTPDRQYVSRYSGHYCQIDRGQQADDQPVASRDHVRLFPTYNRGFYVVGDAHHDHDVVNPGCLPGGHIATDFNGPRNRMAKKWSRRINNGVHVYRWRNTQPRSCSKVVIWSACSKRLGGRTGGPGTAGDGFGWLW